MADAKTLAHALVRRMSMPVIPPDHGSPDGLPAKETALEGADDDLLEALALASGEVTVDELIEALRDPLVRAAGGEADGG